MTLFWLFIIYNLLDILIYVILLHNLSLSLSV